MFFPFQTTCKIWSYQTAPCFGGPHPTSFFFSKNRAKGKVSQNAIPSSLYIYISSFKQKRIFVTLRQVSLAKAQSLKNLDSRWFILLMADILQVVYPIQFMTLYKSQSHPRWLFGMSSINSIMQLDSNYGKYSFTCLNWHKRGFWSRLARDSPLRKRSFASKLLGVVATRNISPISTPIIVSLEHGGNPDFLGVFHGIAPGKRLLIDHSATSSPSWVSFDKDPPAKQHIGDSLSISRLTWI